MRVRIEHVGQADLAGREGFQDLVDLVQTRVNRQGGAAGLVHHEVGQAAIPVGAERVQSEKRGVADGRRHIASLS
jgi:hypothetical protein